MTESTFVDLLRRFTLRLRLDSLEAKVRSMTFDLRWLAREADEADRVPRLYKTPSTGAELVELLWEQRFNPNWPLQPRIPRGNRDGGRWTEGGRGTPTGSPTDLLPAAPRSSPDGSDTTALPSAEWPTKPAELPVIRVSEGGPPIKLPKIPRQRPSDSVVRNDIIKGVAKWLRAVGKAGGTAGLLLDYFEETWLRNDLNEIDAYLDNPKSLEDLHSAVAFPKKGYHIHHIVEKGAARDDGFPESMINSPENLVRIPALVHREISAWYQRRNYKPPYFGMSPRNYLRGKSWNERKQLGLDMLEEFGVLKR